MAALLILTFAFGFVFGVVATVAAEAYGAFVILNKLSKRSQKDLAKVNAKLAQSKPDLHQSLDYLSHKQVFYGALILEMSVCCSKFRFSVFLFRSRIHTCGNFIEIP